MQPEEFCGIEATLERGEAFVVQIGPALDVNADIVAFRLKAHDPVERDPHEFSPGLDPKVAGLGFVLAQRLAQRRHGFVEFEHPLGARARRDCDAGALDRRAQPAGFDRLGDIVDRSSFEGAQRIVVEGGHENDCGCVVAQPFQDIEAGAARHLDVEQDRIRRKFGNHGAGLLHVAGRSHHLNGGHGAEQAQQAPPRQWLVFDDED